jgi:hypothetical protein
MHHHHFVEHNDIDESHYERPVVVHHNHGTDDHDQFHAAPFNVHDYNTCNFNDCTAYYDHDNPPFR